MFDQLAQALQDPKKKKKRAPADEAKPPQGPFATRLPPVVVTSPAQSFGDRLMDAVHEQYQTRGSRHSLVLAELTALAAQPKKKGGR